MFYLYSAPPSEELVSRVKELYNKRVSDVRFLIPVLTGLTKKEVIAVLPKLIKLNPHVVKEVIKRCKFASFACSFCFFTFFMHEI